MRAEDIEKLLYLSTGTVGNHEVGAITALRIIDDLKEFHGNYTLLCNLLQKIGRNDLADLVSGFPREAPRSFAVGHQALHLMMEVLRSKKSLFAFHQAKLRSMKEGDNTLIQSSHSIVLGTILKGLSIRRVSSGVASIMQILHNGFNSQYKYMQCTTLQEAECHSLRHKKAFNFFTQSGSDDDHTESYLCPVAESAHQARKFILEASCEIIGKERTVDVHQLNYEIECGINITMSLE